MKNSTFDRIVWLTILLLLAAIVLTTLVAGSTTRGPQVAFLAPAYGGVQNIWLADIDNPEGARQITFSSVGVYNFHVSPDGRYIAYAENDIVTFTTDLKLLDLHSGQITLLTNCQAQDADCRTPIFRPDGRMLAYERVELNSAVGGTGPGAIRVWLLDLSTSPYGTAPLFADSQVVGHSPRWSGDGRRIAVYSANVGTPGILVYDFAPRGDDSPLHFVPSQHGSMGTLSPNGVQLVFPEIVRRGGSVWSYLKVADLSTNQFGDLTDAMGPTDDVLARWNPDGVRIAIARKYTDDRWTRGHQIYLLNLADGSEQALVNDPVYSSSFFEWDEAGRRLVIQRFPLLNPDGTASNTGRPEIWTYDLETGELKMIYNNGFQPQWVNP